MVRNHVVPRPVMDVGCGDDATRSCDGQLLNETNFRVSEVSLWTFGAVFFKEKPDVVHKVVK